MIAWLLHSPYTCFGLAVLSIIVAALFSMVMATLAQREAKLAREAYVRQRAELLATYAARLAELQAQRQPGITRDLIPKAPR
jgi:hypothetical protein